MKEEQNINKIAKYLSDNIDSKEREELFAWIKEKPENKVFFEDSMEAWEVAEESKITFQPNTDGAWAKMENRLIEARDSNRQEINIRPISFIQPWMRIAAAAVILFGMGLWFYSDTNSGNGIIIEQTVVHDKTTIDLPDGSKVWLNQNSTLKYEKLFDKRVVNLEGEAFFDIAKMNGKPFEIFAGNSKTRVLGTSFNVRAYPTEKKVELTVETGKVAFSAEGKPSENTLLKAGEYATFTKKSKKIKKEKVAKINATAWKKGALRFNNTNMKEVIESLERYYNIEIAVSNNRIYNCTWNNTSTYDKPILDSIIYEIEFGTNISVSEQKKSTKLYRFSGDGCK